MPLLPLPSCGLTNLPAVLLTEGLLQFGGSFFTFGLEDGHVVLFLVHVPLAELSVRSVDVFWTSMLGAILPTLDVVADSALLLAWCLVGLVEGGYRYSCRWFLPGLLFLWV